MNNQIRNVVVLGAIFIAVIGNAQNLVNSSSWTAGQGSVTGFIAQGDLTENVRVLDTDPFNNQSIIWQCITDGGTGYNGGWVTDPIVIDHSKTYRFSVWIKKTGTGNGSEIFGVKVQNSSGNDISISELNGTLENNPSFEASTPPLGEWTLYVGYIHGSGYTGTTNMGGLYDGVTQLRLTNSSLQPTDYKFTSESAFVEFRAHLWSATTIGNVMHIYDPRVYEDNSNMPSIQDLLDGTNPSPDTTPPSAPSNLTSTGTTTTTIALSWTAATDDVAVTGYRVFKDGSAEATLGNVTSYTVSGLTANTSYQFTVRALDAAGNESANSNTINITTNAASDTQSPTPPTVSSPSQTATTVNLSWSGASDNLGVTGYKVFKDGSLEATLGNVFSYEVTGLTPATSYQFTVSALDAAGNESTSSNSMNVTTSGSGGGSSVWTENNAIASYSGNVAVGTTTVPSGYNMAIDGKLVTEEVRVELSTNWPDYVFRKEYELPTLEEIQKHIQENGHLPNIPDAATVAEEGIALGEMNKLLLEKIEELTLYLIQQQEEIKALRAEVNTLKQKH